MIEAFFALMLTDIDGKPVKMSDFQGQAILIVNVASKCGFTPQYEQLEKLYKDYKDQGFVILGFPTNDFLGQEPGTNAQIKEFCSLTYGVTFPMFAKITVVGKDMAPLYKLLTEKNTDPKFSGPITWNFNKFLIDKKGNIAARFPSEVKPDDPQVISALKSVLAGN